MDDKSSFVGTHGTDSTPVAEGAIPTPAQLLYKILVSDAGHRLKICTRMLEAAEESHQCRMLDHDGTIAILTARSHAFGELITSIKTHYERIVGGDSSEISREYVLAMLIGWLDIFAYGWDEEDSDGDARSDTSDSN